MTARASLWRHGDFRKLWAAESISQVGTQVSVVALPLVAILVLDATPLQVGLLTAAEFLPFLVVGLPAGAWVDRMRRRPVLITADVGRAVALGALPLAYAFGALQLWMLYLVAFAVGVLTVFFDVAYGSYLPSIVDRDRLLDGNAKLELSRSGAQIVGPGVGAGLVQAITAPVAVLADAISFAGSAACLVAIRTPEPAPEPPSDDGWGLRREIAEGLRFVLGHPLLRPVLTTTAIFNLGFGATQAVLIVFAVRELGLSPVGVGAVVIAGNVGGLLGAVLSNRVGARMGFGPTIVTSVVVYAVASVLFPLAGGSAGAVLVAAGLFVTGAAAVVYNIAQVSLRQAITPDRLLGRMNSSMRFVVWGVVPVGALLGGVLAGPLGLRWVLWLAFAIGLLAILPATSAPLRATREAAVPESEPSPMLGGERP